MTPTTVGRAARGRAPRRLRSIHWFDRAMGGGLAAGSVTMVHGEPGAGKSTLLAQVAGAVRGAAYASAEEEEGSVARRFRRLGGRRDTALVAESAAEVGEVLAAAGRAPLIVLDSVQTMRCDGAGGRPGSVRQVVAVAQAAVKHARRTGACVVLVCHQTKGGQAAGPRTLEHLVDAAVRLSRGPPRELQVEKNRYGPAGEPPVPLRMTRRGLRTGAGGRSGWRRLRWWGAILLVAYLMYRFMP